MVLHSIEGLFLLIRISIDRQEKRGVRPSEKRRDRPRLEHAKMRRKVRREAEAFFGGIDDAETEWGM